MKLHPRVWKGVMWGGVVVAVLFLGLCLVSERWWFSLHIEGDLWRLDQGRVVYEPFDSSDGEGFRLPDAGWTFRRYEQVFEGNNKVRVSPRGTRVSLWPYVVLCVGVSAFACWRGFAAGRRERV